jgi:hypothetical protein
MLLEAYAIMHGSVQKNFAIILVSNWDYVSSLTNPKKLSFKIKMMMFKFKCCFDNFFLKITHVYFSVFTLAFLQIRGCKLQNRTRYYMMVMRVDTCVFRCFIRCNTYIPSVFYFYLQSYSVC